MAQSLALVVLLGLLANYLFTKAKIPGILGMLVVGIVVGPSVLNLIDPNLQAISGDLRSMALIVILITAGLDIRKADILPVGFIAVKMFLFPSIAEAAAIVGLSMWLLDFSFVQGAILGFILAAVSPAVVVPAMIEIKKMGLKNGTKVASVVLASATANDVFAITMFSVFLSISVGKRVNIALMLLNVPLSILLGIVAGVVIAVGLIFLFKRVKIGNVQKTLILLFSGVLFVYGEKLIKELSQGKFEVAALIGVMVIGLMIREKNDKDADVLAANFGGIWVFAKILLFVLVGAIVNIKVMGQAGLIGIAIVLVGLTARCIGAYLATVGSKNLSGKERLFLVLSCLPKATVQAAIGGLPLAAGAPGGDVILAIAVLSIIISAPLGAIAIKLGAPRLLDGEHPSGASPHAQ